MKKVSALLRQAKAGNTKAMLDLADAYYSGKGTSKNLRRYFFWIKRAAEANDTDAAPMYLLAWAYREGEGTTINLKKYFYWIAKAAELNDKDAMLGLALAYRNGEGTNVDPEQFFNWIKKAGSAKDADPESMFFLAYAYRDGVGTPVNIDEYISWIRKSAEAGDNDAMRSLAWSFHEGTGVKRDDSQFFNLINKAAKANDATSRSLFSLAYAYRWGVGTKINLDSYFHWVKKSASADENDGATKYFLACAYRDGEGTTVDLKQYLFWIKRAAELKDPDAMLDLARAYLHGHGTRQNDSRYFYWVKNAAETNNAAAMLSLAYAYHDAIGTKKNNQKALQWARRSSENGEPMSMYILARSYLHGDGTRPDFEQYNYWIDKASAAGNEDATMLGFINRTLGDVRLKQQSTISIFLELMDLVDEIKSEHKYSEEGTVAHFTSFKTIEEMLPVERGRAAFPANNHLRLYNVEYLNDPHEGCRIFQHMKDSTNAKFQHLYQELFHDLDKKSFISLIHEDLSVYICSFTTRADRLDLWRAYGRDGDGICIITPTKAFDGNTDRHALSEHLREHRVQKDQRNRLTDSARSPENDNLTEDDSDFAPDVLYKVKYENDDINIMLDKLLPSLNKIVKLMSGADIKTTNAIRKCTVAILADILFLYKNQEYKSEGETRLIFAAGINHKMLELDNRSPGKLFVRTNNFLFTHENSGVIIGPKVKEKEATQLNIKFRLNGHGLNNARVDQSKVDYR